MPAQAQVTGFFILSVSAKVPVLFGQFGFIFCKFARKN
jgi:hypothetical protein